MRCGSRPAGTTAAARSTRTSPWTYWTAGRRAVARRHSALPHASADEAGGDGQEEHRRPDGDEEAAEVELIAVRDVDHLSCQEATDDGPRDAKQDRPDDPDRLTARQEQARDR